MYINNTRGDGLAAARTLLGQTAAFRYIKYFLDQWKIFCIFNTSLVRFCFMEFTVTINYFYESVVKRMLSKYVLIKTKLSN